MLLGPVAIARWSEAAAMDPPCGVVNHIINSIAGKTSLTLLIMSPALYCASSIGKRRSGAPSGCDSGEPPPYSLGRSYVPGCREEDDAAWSVGFAVDGRIENRRTLLGGLIWAVGGFDRTVRDGSSFIKSETSDSDPMAALAYRFTWRPI
jgi:hypothetical protein